MTDSGLNHRLRQRSRRSGLIIGLSMALTLALCVGAFTVLYTLMEPFVADFIPSGDTDPTPTEIAQAQPTQPPADQTPVPTATTAPQANATTQSGLTDVQTEAFTPDYQLDSPNDVRLRSGPGVEGNDIVTMVPVDAPLMYLGQEQATENPAGDGLEEGGLWMKFRTEDGDEGWIREIDVAEYQP